jgi:hypothetical protein
MKKLIVALILSFLAINSFTQDQLLKIDWAISIGNSNYDAEIKKAYNTLDGLIFFGRFSKNLTIGNVSIEKDKDNSEYFFGKINNNGEAEWLSNELLDQDFSVIDVEFSANNEIVVLGTIQIENNLITVIQVIDKFGSFQDSTHLKFNTHIYSFEDIAIDNDQNIILKGLENKNEVVVKLNSNFEIIWKKSFCTNRPKYFDKYSLLTILNNNSIVFFCKFDTSAFEINGNSPSIEKGVCIVKINKNGIIENYLIEKDAKVYPRYLKTDKYNNIYFAGDFCSDSISMDNIQLKKVFPPYLASFIFKFNPELKCVWGTLIDGKDFDCLRAFNVNIYGKSVFKVYSSLTDSIYINQDILPLSEKKHILLCMLDEKGKLSQYEILEGENEYMGSNSLKEILVFNNDGKMIFTGKVGNNHFLKNNLNQDSVSYLLKASNNFLSTPELKSRPNNVICPNPNQGNFYLGTNDIKKPDKIMIYDLNGRLRFEDKYTANIISVDLSSGIYIVNIILEDGKVQTEKMIVQKF